MKQTRRASAFPLRLVSLTTGVTHYGRQVPSGYLEVACSRSLHTPSWRRMPSQFGWLLGKNGLASVTCARCLSVTDEAS